MRADTMMGSSRGAAFGRPTTKANRPSSASLDTDTPGMSDAFAMTLLVILPRIGDGIRLGLKAAPAGIAVVLIALALNAMMPESVGPEPRAAAPASQQDPETTGAVR